MQRRRAFSKLQGAMSSAQWRVLDIEAEMDNIAVLYDVIFAF